MVTWSVGIARYSFQSSQVVNAICELSCTQWDTWLAVAPPCGADPRAVCFGAGAGGSTRPAPNGRQRSGFGHRGRLHLSGLPLVPPLSSTLPSQRLPLQLAPHRTTCNTKHTHTHSASFCVLRAASCSHRWHTLSVLPRTLKVSSPSPTKHPGWYVDAGRAGCRCYLAVKQLPAITARTGARFSIRPVRRGRLPPPRLDSVAAAGSLEAAHLSAELDRWRRRLRLPM